MSLMYNLKSYLFRVFLLLILLTLNNCSTNSTAKITKDITTKELSFENVEIPKTYNLKLIRFSRDESSTINKRMKKKKNIENLLMLSSNLSSKNFSFESGLGLSNIEEYLIEIISSIKINPDNVRFGMQSTSIEIEKLE